MRTITGESLEEIEARGGDAAEVVRVYRNVLAAQKVAVVWDGLGGDGGRNQAKIEYEVFQFEDLIGKSVFIVPED